jgi:hypothetical protein
VGQEEDNNASVLSVKERAKHLNRIESESEIQKVSSSNLGAVRKKEHRKVCCFLFCKRFGTVIVSSYINIYSNYRKLMKND